MNIRFALSSLNIISNLLLLYRFIVLLLYRNNDIWIYDYKKHNDRHKTFFKLTKSWNAKVLIWYEPAYKTWPSPYIS